MPIRWILVLMTLLLCSNVNSQNSSAFGEAQLEAYFKSVCAKPSIAEGEGVKLYLCGVCPEFTPAPGWQDPNGGAVWEYANRVEGRFSQNQRPEVILNFQGCEQIEPGGGAVLLQFEAGRWQQRAYLSGPPFEPGFSSLERLRQKNGLDLIVGLSDFVREGKHRLWLTASQYQAQSEGQLQTQLLFRSELPDLSACKGVGKGQLDSANVKAGAGKLTVRFKRQAFTLSADCQPKFAAVQNQTLEWVLQGANLVPNVGTAKLLRQLGIAP